MHVEHLKFLVCPKSGRPLTLVTPAEFGRHGQVKRGLLLESDSGRRYPIVDHIPRFVSDDDYARSFGFQWNIHARTQYDDYAGFSASRERFERETKWGRELPGLSILEVGSGAGRFTRHALSTGATVVSFDSSSAVTANWSSNGENPNLLLVQASIFEVPFPPLMFDRVFCFGVLQHTPDPKAAFFSIVNLLKPGGTIAADIYVKDIRNWLLNPKYWVRPFFRGKQPDRLYGFVKRYIDLMWPVAKILRRIPRIGHALNWRLLIADHSGFLADASDPLLKEWAYLDTFDMISPLYDKPQTLKTFRSWHEEAGLQDIDVHLGFNGIEGRGTRPAYE